MSAPPPIATNSKASSSQPERRTANDNGIGNGKARMSSGPSRSQASDHQRQPSQQSSQPTDPFGRPGTVQRTKRGNEERRTEKLQVTTRETLTSKIRSPERRSAPSGVPMSRSTSKRSADQQPKNRRPETPQGMTFRM